MKIVLKKISVIDMEIIHQELLLFMRNKIDTISDCKDYQQYCNDIILIDILQSMFVLLRSKIEGHQKTVNLTLKPSQGVVLLYCCISDNATRSQEIKNTMHKMAWDLHNKLINI